MAFYRFEDYRFEEVIRSILGLGLACVVDPEAHSRQRSVQQAGETVWVEITILAAPPTARPRARFFAACRIAFATMLSP